MNKINKNIILVLVIIFLVILISLIFHSFMFTRNGFSKKEQNNLNFDDISFTEDYSIISHAIEPKSDNWHNDLVHLNNPNVLLAFLNEYFVIQPKPNNFQALSLDDFYDIKKGSTFDFTVFIANVLNFHNYKTGIIRLDYHTMDEDTGSYAVVIFRDNDLPKYIVATESGVFMFHHGWSFYDLIKAEQQRLGIKIYRYAYFPVGSYDFTVPIKPYEWEIND